VIELNAPAAIDFDRAGIAFPSNTKTNNAIGFGYPFEYSFLSILVMFQVERHHSVNDFLHRLMEFGLIGISLSEADHKSINFLLMRGLGNQFLFSLIQLVLRVCSQCKLSKFCAV
jgi:hypothetical protein